MVDQLTDAPEAPDRESLVLLTAMAIQGFVIAINGVGAPWMMRTFGVGEERMATAFAWISVSTALAFGLARLADRFGRRRVLTWCLLIESASAVVVGLSLSLVAFVVANIVLLAAANAAVSCGVVWIAERSPADQRAARQGHAGFAVTLGSGPAVLLMPWIAETGVGWPLMLFAVAPAFLLIPLLPKAGLLPAPSVQSRGPRPALTTPAIVLLVTTVLSTTATSTVDAWRFVHMVVDSKLDAAVASVLLTVIGVFGFAGFALGAKSADRFGRVITVAISLVVMVLAIAFAFLGPPAGFHPVWLWFALGFTTMVIASNAITVASNTAISEMFPPDVRATMFGGLLLAGAIGRTAAQTLVAVLAPHLGGAANAVGTLALVGVPAAIVLIKFLPERSKVLR